MPYIHEYGGTLFFHPIMSTDSLKMRNFATTNRHRKRLYRSVMTNNGLVNKINNNHQ